MRSPGGTSVSVVRESWRVRGYSTRQHYLYCSWLVRNNEHRRDGEVDGSKALTTSRCSSIAANQYKGKTIKKIIVVYLQKATIGSDKKDRELRARNGAVNTRIERGGNIHLI